jgi:hypothetical protein
MVRQRNVEHPNGYCPQLIRTALTLTARVGSPTIRTSLVEDVVKPAVAYSNCFPAMA